MLLIFLLFFVPVITQLVTANDQYGRHRREDLSFKNLRQEILTKTFSYGIDFEKLLNDTFRKNEAALNEFRQKILEISGEIANTSKKSQTRESEWLKIQKEIRSALNVIKSTYENYKTINRQNCIAVDNFIEKIIDRYNAEISKLARISPPMPPKTPENSNSTADELKAFWDKIKRILNYSNYHVQTLPLALRAAQDMILHTYQSHQMIFSPVSVPSVSVEIRPGIEADRESDYRTFTVSCASANQNNGIQPCADDISAASLLQAQSVCDCDN